MPSGALARRLALLAGLILAAMLVYGLIVGAIGSAIGGREAFVPQPAIHLAPQPVFPASTRNECLGLSDGHSCASPGGDGGQEAEAAPSSEGSQGHGAEATAEATSGEGASGHGSEEGAAIHAVPLKTGQFAITNTLLSAWLATIVIILFFILGSRKRSLVPGRFQNLVEILVEGLLNFATGVLGADMARKAFPVVATIFFFVLVNAWLALFPFYQFIGYQQSGDSEIVVHLFRSAGTDLNMPLALALVSFVFVEYWGFRAHRFGYLKKFFAFGNLLRLRPTGLIDVFVGVLELISEFVRVVSFTFRLFGNLTAGEILVVMITFLVPFVATQFVFGLELLVGLIQSVIFAGLTLVFLSVAVSHGEH